MDIWSGSINQLANLNKRLSLFEATLEGSITSRKGGSMLYVFVLRISDHSGFWLCGEEAFGEFVSCSRRLIYLWFDLIV